MSNEAKAIDDGGPAFPVTPLTRVDRLRRLNSA